MRIRYKKKKRKTRKLYGQKYRGYGQVGRHRHHPGGRGMAGSKDHMKMHLLKKGHVFGAGRGFTRHGVKHECIEVNIGRIEDFARKIGAECYEENEKLVVDLSKVPYLKVLGSGKIDRPMRLIVNKNFRISEKAKTKIEEIGGEIVYPSSS